MTKHLLSWREIESNALTFAKEWEGEISEDSEAQTFWNDFFEIFGMRRRRVALFEAKVKTLSKNPKLRYGKIDLFWPNVLLVEHKSFGKDLDTAFEEAIDYALRLTDDETLPKYLLVSDFANFRLYDLDTKKRYEFKLQDLYKYIRLFGFISGRSDTANIESSNPINQEAAEALGELHEQFKAIGYTGHNLEVLLVRLLFCLFAQSTEIFDRGSFQKLIQNTRENGKDTGARISELFEVLNTEPGSRLKILDDELSSFQYINGNLFKERIPSITVNSNMRQSLLDCCKIDWAEISPAIFGTLFQSIMDNESRRTLGAHYTSEKNILKLVNSLFLNVLRDEFEKIKKNKKQTLAFHEKLRSLTFLDPACGCGNFLVIAYRELRLLELDVIRALKDSEELFLDIQFVVKVDVDQFFGIELEEFPAQIAQVALWLTDHQMNRKISVEFGKSFARIPLKTSPCIICGNSLRIDWDKIIPIQKLSYILGNPPFKGPHHMNSDQRDDTHIVFQGIKNSGLLDYVAAWYVKAAEYLTLRKPTSSPKILCAFVSTNSIVQGEQVSVLWRFLIDKGIKIHFAHRTFSWSNEAKGKAAVHCVIIGFGLEQPKKPLIFEYPDIKAEPEANQVNHINPYLLDAPDILVTSRNRPLCPSPTIRRGCQPIDDGNYLFTPEERIEFLKKEPSSFPYFHRWIGSEEFLNNIERWCLWLGDCPSHILRNMPEALKRVQAVRKFRQERKRISTQKLANTPTQFQVTIMPKTQFLIIPGVSTERRLYIPLGWMSPDVIIGEKCLIIQEANMYHFGILSSSMHMSWVRTVSGRMKSDYSYSAKIVYNNFPWPKHQERHKKKIIDASQNLINVREKYFRKSLADLYDPLTMPKELLQAHQNLDREVDAAYGIGSIKSELQRAAFLFNLYAELSK